jgi:TatD DNase family protein
MPGTYFDIHTHSEQNGREGVYSIKNQYIQDIQVLFDDKSWFSIGLHPWDTGSVDFHRDPMNDLLRKPNIIAIGECGIDKLQGADILTQTDLFKQQALLGEAHSKPMIIHCVQAWQEIIALKKEIRPKVPWIIHGFRGKPELAGQLINHGFYLSFGDTILYQNNTTAQSLKSIPEDFLFLETDISEHTIESIYQAAAVIKNLPLDVMQNMLQRNFELVFGIHGTS